MVFQTPTTADIFAAIGSVKGLSSALRRALSPDDDFEPLSSPRSGDWLAEHPERGQPFDEYIRFEANRPDSIRNIIYLQPLGSFEGDRGPSLRRLQEHACAYFMMAVEILPVRHISETDLSTRVSPYSQKRQILTTDVLTRLQKNLPENAFCVLGVTMEDLYPDPRWNFVFGQASLLDRVGVFSFARYDPAFYGEPRNRYYPALLLRRSMKVLVHETAHMFSLAHCIYFKCVMNGSNHLQESDSRPLAVCPVCLHKLQHSIGFDVAGRYRLLHRFYRKIGFNAEENWVLSRLRKIESSSRPAP